MRDAFWMRLCAKSLWMSLMFTRTHVQFQNINFTFARKFQKSKMSRKKNKNRASKASKDSIATSMKPPKDLMVTKTKKKRQKGHEFALKTGAMDLLDEPINKDVDDENLGQRMQKDGSASAFYKEVSKVIEAADVILEVLDARDPLGTRCKQMEEAVRAFPHKRVVLLLNKADLVPRDNIAKWIKYLRRELPAIAFKASTQNQRKRLGQKGTLTILNLPKSSGDSCHCMEAV